MSKKNKSGLQNPTREKIPVEKESFTVEKTFVEKQNKSLKASIEKLKIYLEDKVHKKIHKQINQLAKFQQKENISLVKELGLTVKKTITEELNNAEKLEQDYQGEIEQLNKQHKKATGDLENEIIKLNKNLENERKKVEAHISSADTADQQRYAAEKENTTLNDEIEKLKSLTEQQNEIHNIVLKNLFDDEESKRFIMNIPSDNLNLVYSALVILESNLFISKTISAHDNASQVIDTKRENITLQIISIHLMDAVNDKNLDKIFVKEIIEFVNNKSNSYEILKPERFFSSDIHKPISDGGGLLKDIAKHYSLPIRLKDAPDGTVKITKGLVDPR